MSGGAGYVLSREAVKRFAQQAYANRVLCRQTRGGSEDKEMGTCLQNVGVVAGDSRDDQNRGRFFPTSLYSHIIPKPKSSWYWRYIFYATEDVSTYFLLFIAFANFGLIMYIFPLRVLPVVRIMLYPFIMFHLIICTSWTI